MNEVSSVISLKRLNKAESIIEFRKALHKVMRAYFCSARVKKFLEFADTDKGFYIHKLLHPDEKVYVEAFLSFKENKIIFVGEENTILTPKFTARISNLLLPNFNSHKNFSGQNHRRD